MRPCKEPWGICECHSPSSVRGTGCCSCCALVALLASTLLTYVSNWGMLHGEGFFCDRRCNAEAADSYESALQETCYDDSGEWLGSMWDPCDLSLIHI